MTRLKSDEAKAPRLRAVLSSSIRFLHKQRKACIGPGLVVSVIDILFAVDRKILRFRLANFRARKSLLRPPQNRKTAFRRFLFAGPVGIEPTLSVLETDVLPLNYGPWRGASIRARNGYGPTFLSLAEMRVWGKHS